MSNKVREKRYYISGPTGKRRYRHMCLLLGLIATGFSGTFLMCYVVNFNAVILIMVGVGVILPMAVIFAIAVRNTIIACFYNYFTVVGDTLVIKRYKLTTRRIKISEIKMLKIGKSDDPYKGGSIIGRGWGDLAVINHTGSVLFYVIDDAEVVAFFRGLGIPVDRFDPGAPTNFSGRYKK